MIFLPSRRDLRTPSRVSVERCIDVFDWVLPMRVGISQAHLSPFNRTSTMRYLLSSDNALNSFRLDSVDISVSTDMCYLSLPVVDPIHAIVIHLSLHFSEEYRQFLKHGLSTALHASPEFHLPSPRRPQARAELLAAGHP